MRMLLGTFGRAWNIRRRRQGHVFQGRYKAVPVNGGDAGAKEVLRISWASTLAERRYIPHMGRL